MSFIYYKHKKGFDSYGRKHGIWSEKWHNGKPYLYQNYKHGQRHGLTRYRSFIGDHGCDYYAMGGFTEGEFIEYLYTEEENEIRINVYNI